MTDIVRTSSSRVKDLHADAAACLSGKFERLWISEVAGFDAVGLAAHTLTLFPELPLVVGPLPATLRSGPQLAMVAATLGAIGRNVEVVIGASSPAVVNGWHGRARGGARVIEAVISAYEQAASGTITDVDDLDMPSHGFRLRVPSVRAPLGVAALGPKMRGLAARRANELVLNLVTAEKAAEYCSEFHAAVPAARRASARVTAWVHVALDANTEEREICRRFVARYMRAPGYRNDFAAMGFADVISHMSTIERFAAVVAAVPDALLDALVVLGGDDDLRKRIALYEQAGVNVALSCPIPAQAAHKRVTARLTKSASASGDKAAMRAIALHSHEIPPPLEEARCIPRD